MTTPLYIRGGVEQDLPEIITFYEDVAKQMTDAYNGLYKTLIEIKDKLNTTEQTLEITLKEKEKLVKQNECLITEIKKEPINLNSTHILHNILCNKAEAYKILKESEYCEMSQQNSNVEHNDITKREVKNIPETEMQLKNHYSQVEDLLNQWKNKFENPIINLTLNLTPAPKVTMQRDMKKNKMFNSWQDELKHYVKGKCLRKMTTTKNETNKAVDDQPNKETCYKEELIKPLNTHFSDKPSETNVYSKPSIEEKIEKDNTMQNPENKDINEKIECKQNYNKTYSLCSNKMNSNDKIGSLKKYDELQFSDNSVNSTEKRVEKLSKENKMLNIILNQKKMAYAQVYENHAQGSSYEVFQNLQNMENVQNIKNIQNNGIGDASLDVHMKTLQQLQKNNITDLKPNFSYNPSIPLATISPNVVNNNVAIDSTEHVTEKENWKHDKLIAEKRKLWVENKRKHKFDVVNEQIDRNSIPLSKFDKTFNSITNNVHINDSISINNNLNDWGINCQKYKKQNIYASPDDELLHNSNNNSDLCNNNKGAHRKETTFIPSFFTHNKINGHNKSNLNDINRIQVSSFFSPDDKSMHLENCSSLNFSNDHYFKSMEPLIVYRDRSQPINILGTTYGNSDNNSNSRSNFEASNYFNHLNSFHNRANFEYPYNSNAIINRMQPNWEKHTPYEFANAGDTIFYGSTSSVEPKGSYLNTSKETTKNSMAHSYNCYHGRSNYINGNCELHFPNNIDDNAYEINKMLRSKSSHVSRGNLNGTSRSINEARGDFAKNISTNNIVYPSCFENNKKNAYFKKAKKSKNCHKKKKKKHYKNTDNENENENDEYKKSKSDNSNNSSLLNSLCKTVTCQNIRNNNLTSNYIDMNFDERLLPYYKENDSIIYTQSNEKKYINEYMEYSDSTRTEKTERKRKRQITSSTSSKAGTAVRSDVCNKSCTSDGLVSLSSCNDIHGLNKSNETWCSNFTSNIESEMETQTATVSGSATETPNETETEMRNVTNTIKQEQTNLRNISNKIKGKDIYPCQLENRRKRRRPNITSNDISCISVCGSFSREEELKNLITEQGNGIEKEKKKQKTKNRKKGKNDNCKMMIKAIKPLHSVKTVRETNRKKTAKGTKRIETTVPWKKEETEKKENKKEKKEIDPIYYENKQITNKKYNNKIINVDINGNTKKNIFCYTSNEGPFKASLETIVSTFLETKDETYEAVNIENGRQDKYELRAQKKITYVMPSIKRKLRRDSARQIFDPFLYNTMWKINK